MDEADWLAERFEQHRPRLRAVAYRMLGSAAEADDALQEAWLRLSRSDTSSVANMGGWLTTIVARTCLDLLRSRRSRREEPAGEHLPELAGDGDDPEHQALVADSVGLALLVVLDALTPAERLAFVLHDMFDVPFDQIAPVIERSPAATRQIASRARRRVRAVGPGSGSDPARQREVVTAFLAASRGGDFAALVALLDPGVALRTDREGVQLGAPEEIVGAHAVAGVFADYARGARPALVNGLAGAVWAPGGRPRVAFVFTVADGTITAINRVANPDRLRELNLVILDDLGRLISQAGAGPDASRAEQQVNMRPRGQRPLSWLRTCPAGSRAELGSSQPWFGDQPTGAPGNAPGAPCMPRLPARGSSRQARPDWRH
jgi:RNA polymerase sigma factor (sigma-70 family)